MAGQQISIAIVANAKPAVASMTETSVAATKMGQDFDQASASITSAVDKIGSSTQGMTADIDRASASVSNLGDRMGDGASKSAQFAGGVGDLGGALSQLPGPLGSLGSGMEMLGPSLMGIVGAFDLMELAANSNAVAWIRNAAATTVSRVSMVASAAAAGVMTAAQWALNVAMSANPIGLVVLAIVALVAIFVIAYQKSETFRNIVTASWQAIKTAAVATFGAVWTFIKGIFTKIGDVWQTLLSIPQKMRDIGLAIINGITSGFESGIKYLKDKIAWLGNLMPDSLAKILQIRSPSRRFMKLGVESIRGYAIGFNSMKAKDILAPLSRSLTASPIAIPSAQTTLASTGPASASSTGTTVVMNNTINVPENAANPAEYGRRVADALQSFKRIGGVIPT